MLCLSKILFSVFFEQQHCIVSSKSKIRAHGCSKLHFSLFIGNVIQITFRIRCLVIHRRRNNLIFDRPRHNHCLQTPSSSQSMSRNTLRTRNHEFPILLRRMLPKHGLKRHRLKLIIVIGRRPMRIHVPNIRLLQPRLRNRHFHRLRQPPPLRRRSRNMISIARGPIPDHLAINIRPSGQGALQTLEDDHSAPLAHDEATAIGVEGTRSRRGIVVVSGGHGFHGAEAGVGEGSDGGFGSAGDHSVRDAVGDHAEGFSDGVGGGGAGGSDAVVGALGAAFDADDAGGGVSEEGGDGEG
mmetsp:Transcript_17512/g.35117  ORF Transcript_17512/g.35117 Transcript_17512/m.35117 type:complete len:297 (+) Transcript_17512:112-1002(+)